MENVLASIKKGIISSAEKQKNIEDGCTRGLMSVNSYLREAVHGFSALLVGMQQIDDEKFIMKLILTCQATGVPPMQQVFGEVTKDFPLPTEDELCKMIMKEVDAQIVDDESCLMQYLGVYSRVVQNERKPKIQLPGK